MARRLRAAGGGGSAGLPGAEEPGTWIPQAPDDALPHTVWVLEDLGLGPVVFYGSPLGFAMDESVGGGPSTRRHESEACQVFEDRPVCRASRRGDFVLRYDRVEIRGSAHKHGIDDEDIEHAVEHALLVAELDEDRRLYLGPDRAANLLEVVAVLRASQPPLVIHAMRMQKRYEPYLRGLEVSDE